MKRAEMRRLLKEEKLAKGIMAGKVLYVPAQRSKNFRLTAKDLQSNMISNLNRITK